MELNDDQILAKVPDDCCHCCAVTRFKAGKPFRPLHPRGVVGERNPEVIFVQCDFCDNPNSLMVANYVS